MKLICPKRWESITSRLGALGLAPGMAYDPRWHLLWLLILASGMVMRLLADLAYANAFFFPDSRAYILFSFGWVPDAGRPFGYSLFLKPFFHWPFRLFGSPRMIVFAQHLMGIGMAALGYLFMLRRKVHPGLAAMATVPILLDARMIAVEHHVASEALFIALVGSGLILLSWQERLRVPMALVAGTLLAGASLTRAVALPLIILGAGYLLLRKVGWRPLAGFIVAFWLVYGAYLVWYHHHHGVYASSQYAGRFLHARVLSIADCERLQLTDKQRTLCPPTPPSNREQRPDSYIWSETSAAKRLYPGVEHDPFLYEFAETVIRQQAWDYLGLVVRETAWHFLPAPPVDEYGRCIIRKWLLPAIPNDVCGARMFTRDDQAPEDVDLVPIPPTRLSTMLSRYSSMATLPGPLLAVAMLFGLLAAVWPGERSRRREGLDAALFASCGLALIGVSVATSMYEMRYLLPSLFLIPVGAALGMQRMFGKT